MNTGLLISIGVMVLITLIASITTLVIVTKYTKQEKIVGKVLKIVGIVIAALAVLALAIGISFVKKDDSKSPKDYNEVTLNGCLTFFTAYRCLVFTSGKSPSNLLIMLFFSVFIFESISSFKISDCKSWFVSSVNKFICSVLVLL